MENIQARDVGDQPKQDHKNQSETDQYLGCLITRETDGQDLAARPNLENINSMHGGQHPYAGLTDVMVDTVRLYYKGQLEIQGDDWVQTTKHNISTGETFGTAQVLFEGKIQASTRFSTDLVFEHGYFVRLKIYGSNGSTHCDLTFSFPKVLSSSNVYGLTASERAEAVKVIDEKLAQIFKTPISIRQFHISRLDLAMCFEPVYEMEDYQRLFHSLPLNRTISRLEYNSSLTYGVNAWRITLHDKAKMLRDEGIQVQREISSRLYRMEIQIRNIRDIQKKLSFGSFGQLLDRYEELPSIYGKFILDKTFANLPFSLHLNQERQASTQPLIFNNLKNGKDYLAALAICQLANFDLTQIEPMLKQMFSGVKGRSNRRIRESRPDSFMNTIRTIIQDKTYEDYSRKGNGKDLSAVFTDLRRYLPYETTSESTPSKFIVPKKIMHTEAFDMIMHFIQKVIGSGEDYAGAQFEWVTEPNACGNEVLSHSMQEDI